MKSSHRRGECEAVFFGQSSPLPFLLVMNESGENVDPPLLPAFGADVAQHDATEEDSVERQDDEDVQGGIPIG